MLVIAWMTLVRAMEHVPDDSLEDSYMDSHTNKNASTSVRLVLARFRERLPFVSVTALKSCHHFRCSGLRRFFTRPMEDLFWGPKQNQAYVVFVTEPT
jgi:hypothetical protein